MELSLTSEYITIFSFTCELLSFCEFQDLLVGHEQGLLASFWLWAPSLAHHLWATHMPSMGTMCQAHMLIHGNPVCLSPWESYVTSCFFDLTLLQYYIVG